MAVYRKLRDIDVLQTVLTTSPRISASSGSVGWKGGPAGSGSISVYTGFRGPGNHTVSIRPVVFPSINDIGLYRPTSGSYPVTASFRYVDVLLQERTENRNVWGLKSWSTVEGLYEFYSRYNSNYSRDTYDFKCVFFKRQGYGVVSPYDRDAGHHLLITSSLTVEAWIKPFSTAGSDEMTIACRGRGMYWLGLTGQDNKLTFSASFGSVTSSLPVPLGKWSHVAVTFNYGTGSMYIDLRHAGDFNFIDPIDDMSFGFSIGNRTIGNSHPSSGDPDIAFHGLIHEVREWDVARTWEQLSASFSRRIPGDSAGLINYFSPREGLLSGSSHLLIGSSSVNASLNRGAPDYNFIFDAFGDAPVWQPCDNRDFHPEKRVHTREVDQTRYRVLNVPRLLYGRQIATGTFEMTCRAFSKDGTELVRVLRDDGRGSLYVHSYMSSSLEDVGGVPWNRVGNIFYSEGLVVITDNSMLDFATSHSASAHHEDVLSVSFRGLTNTPVKVTSCRVEPGEANASINQTYYTVNSGGTRELVDQTRTTWITGIAFYDDEGRLVGIAKLATPMRKRERDRLNIRVRMDL